MKKSGRSNQRVFSTAHYIGVVVLLVIAGFFVSKFLSVKKISLPVVGDNLEVEKIGELPVVLTTPTPEPRWMFNSIGNFEGSAYLIRGIKDESNIYEFFGNLPEVTDGQYVGWLVNTKDKHYVQLGNVLKIKGSWYLYFQTKGNVDLYEKMWITLEKKEDELPEKKLLEIDFKKVR